MLEKIDYRRHDEPFTWVHIREFLPAAAARRLAEEFPAAELSESRSPTAHYHLSDCTVIEDGEPTDVVQRLTPGWQDFVELLLSAAYREFVAEATGADLDGCRLKVRPCQYEPGHFMTAHTDKPDRVVTQVVYLNADWPEEWGGQLDILTRPDDDDPQAVAARVWPRLNNSVLFVRCDRSYHAVRPVDVRAGGLRRSVLAQFVASGG